MTKLKPWFGYILWIVSIIESIDRNIGGGGQFVSNAQSFPSKQKWQTNANFLFTQPLYYVSTMPDLYISLQYTSPQQLDL